MARSRSRHRGPGARCPPAPAPMCPAWRVASLWGVFPRKWREQPLDIPVRRVPDRDAPVPGPGATQGDCPTNQVSKSRARSARGGFRECLDCNVSLEPPTGRQKIAPDVSPGARERRIHVSRAPFGATEVGGVARFLSPVTGLLERGFPASLPHRTESRGYCRSSLGTPMRQLPGFAVTRRSEARHVGSRSSGVAFRSAKERLLSAGGALQARPRHCCRP